MKRRIIMGLFLCSLLFLEQRRPILGQDAGAGIPDKRTSPQSPRWETIGDTKVLRVWAIEGPDKYPQVSLLQVSTKHFHKFMHDPVELRKFVNDHNVFSKTVLTVGPCVTLSSVDETSDKPGWIITLVHTAASRMTISALPANPELQPLK